MANQTERSVSLYELNRRGELVALRGAIPMTIAGSNPPANMVPRTLTWQGRHLFVALDAPSPSEDVIRAFHVIRRVSTEDTDEELDDTSATEVRRQQAAMSPDVTVEELGDTPAGAFLTDIEATKDGLFAVTVNANGPGPADDRDEIRVYRIENGTDLTLDASVQIDSFPPNFKQISTFPARGSNDRHVIVTEFQGGWLRSLLYDRRRQNDEEEEKD